MNVSEIMTPDPVCCAPDASLTEVAQMMVEYDCGEIPVTENRETKRLVGVITDRDIVCRSLGKALNPMEMQVSECMSRPAVTVRENASLNECAQLMQENQIRRVPVVAEDDTISGIVALADITKHLSEEDAGEVLRDVSAETDQASSAG